MHSVVIYIHGVYFNMSQINAKSFGKSRTIIIRFERTKLKLTTVGILLWRGIIILIISRSHFVLYQIIKILTLYSKPGFSNIFINKYNIVQVTVFSPFIRRYNIQYTHSLRSENIESFLKL